MVVSDPCLRRLVALAAALLARHPDLFADRPLPEYPTVAIPGSKEKILVMRQRILRGEQPHHPGDLTLSQLDRMEKIGFRSKRLANGNKVRLGLRLLRAEEPLPPPLHLAPDTDSDPPSKTKKYRPKPSRKTG